MLHTAWGICSQDDICLEEGEWIKEHFFNAIVDVMTSEVADKVCTQDLRLLDQVRPYSSYSFLLICPISREVQGVGSTQRNQAVRPGHSVCDGIRAQQQRTLTVVASGTALPAGPNSRPGVQTRGWNGNWDDPGMVPLVLQLPS
jgi:hypothetical protein